MYAAADLFALSHNGSALQLKLLYTLSTISQSTLYKKTYIFTHSMFTWHCVCMHVLALLSN